MSKTVWAIIIVILLVLGAWFWFSGPSEAPTTGDTTPVATSTTTGGAGSFTTLPAPAASSTTPAATSMVKEFTVTGKNFSFAPNTITVNNGDTVKITFKNESGFHDLKIDEFNAATKQIQAGAQETITFVANKTGSFEYYCSVGTHRQMGMKGTLVVK